MIPAMTPSRASLPVLTAAALMLAACGGGGDEPEGLETTTAPVTETAEPTPTEVPNAEAVASIEAQYQRYWDVIVTSENTLDDSYEELTSVAVEPVAQTQVAYVRNLRNNGVTREGAPELGPPEITVDGSTARVEGCVDEDPWIASVDGEQIAVEQRGPTPRVFVFELVDGAWLVSERLEPTEATITC